MMVFLGLIVAAAAVGVGVGVTLENTSAVTLTVFGKQVPGVTTEWQVFLVGAAVAVVFTGGLTLASIGLSRAMRVRRELQDLREEHEESVNTLEMEKRQLQRELARARRNAPETPVVPQQAAGSDPMSSFFDQQQQA